MTVVILRFAAVAALSPKARMVLKALEERDLSVRWASRQIGVSDQSLWNWLKGVHEPSDPEILDQLLDIIQGKGMPKGAGSGTKALMAEVPCVTNTAVFEVPAEFAVADYRVLLIEDDSMMPRLHPGDTAIFRQWRVPRDGLVNAIACNGGVFVRGLLFREGQFVQVALNPKYEDVPLDSSSTILGYLVGIYRDDGIETMSYHNRGGVSVH